jgi:hypothetical protein
MLKGTRLWVALITIGFLATSCTSVSLPRLQTEFDQLYREREACLSQGTERGKDVTKVKSIPCMEQAEAAFFDVARSAKSAADTAGDQRTKIALLRLAGVSLWQSGRGGEKEGNALVNDICFQGESICKGIEGEVKKGEIYGAPRDCALLAILPALVWHSEYKRRLEDLRREIPSEQGKEELSKIIENYANNTVLFVSTKKEEVRNYTGISRSVLEYIEEVQKRSFCNFQMAEEIVLGHDMYRDLEERLDNQFKIMSQETGLNRVDDCR